MKKIGIIIFIVALAAGVVLSKVFSLGSYSIKSPISLSFDSKIHGSGDIQTEKRSLTGFKRLDISGVFDVEVVAQKDFNVEVEADDNLFEYILTEVDGDTLEISTRKRFSTKNTIKIRISAPNIEAIENSGVSRVTISNLDNDSLKIDSTGASQVIAYGETTYLEIDLSGASTVNAKGLTAPNVAVEASGASSAKINVLKKLEVSLSGASSVKYKGKPESIDKRTSGASSISEIE